jgi:hypothetical protein
MRYYFLIASCLPFLAGAQGWAPIGATWTYKQGQVASPDTNLATITLTGDTVIQGKSCDKLEIIDGYFNCFPFYDFIHYNGDSLWIHDAIDDRFMLLMCMNALPGDSWATELQHSSGGVRDTITWTVLDTATIIVDGIPLRSLDLSYASANLGLSPYCWPHCTFIERIGNLKYLFDLQNGVCDAETFLGLRCYEDNDISWQSPSVPQCALSTSIAAWHEPAFFSLSPNPVAAGEPLFLELQVPSTPVEVIVHDALGREVLRSNLKDMRTQMTISVSGVYVVTLQQAGTVLAQQRLVVR